MSGSAQELTPEDFLQAVALAEKWQVESISRADVVAKGESGF